VNGPESLRQIVIKAPCIECDHQVSATLKKLLYQPDYAGTDYEEGGTDATVTCKNKDCGAGIYVTNLCIGKPEFDNGKFHNHCDQCPYFGKCFGDYRDFHCHDCGEHFFGNYGGCDNCECKRKMVGSDSDSERDEESEEELDEELEEIKRKLEKKMFKKKRNQGKEPTWKEKYAVHQMLLLLKSFRAAK